MLQSSTAVQGTKWISVAGFIRGAAGFTESRRQMVRQHPERYSPHYYFHAVTLSSRPQCFPARRRSHTQICSRGLVSVAPLSYEFCKDIALFFQYSHRANCMPCQSVPHMHKALSCGLLKRFISVTKEIKQRQRINACRLDAVLHFKEDECTKRSTQLCLLSVCPCTFQV